MMITKRNLKQVLAAKDADLARLFSITPSAIAQWREDGPVPQIRQWQLRVLRPDIFGVFPQAHCVPSFPAAELSGPLAGVQEGVGVRG